MCEDKDKDKTKTIDILKKCIGCKKELTLDDYYLAVRGKYERYHSRCKKCHCIKRRENMGPLKLLGFNKLDADVQKDIIEMLKNKHKKKEIAHKHGLKYGTFCCWVRKGNILTTSI